MDDDLHKPRSFRPKTRRETAGGSRVDALLFQRQHNGGGLGFTGDGF